MCTGTDHAADESILTHEAGTDESVTEAIVTAVASVSDSAPAPTREIRTDSSEPVLAPLYRSVDTDALDCLVAPRSGSSRSDVEISFSYQNYEVTVWSCGSIGLRPLTPANDGF